MTQVLHDIRSSIVLLTALAVSGAGWWLVVAEPAALPGFICGMTGYGSEPGAWSIELLTSRFAMWLAMMLAMTLPVGAVIGARAGRVQDAAFLAGYAGTAASVAVVAAVLEWMKVSVGFGGATLSLQTGMSAGVAFAALGLLGLVASALRNSESCMRETGGWRLGSLFSPAGRRAEHRRGDEGAAEGPMTDASLIPSSDPADHLLSAGEKRDQSAALRSSRFLQGLHQGRAALACSLTMAGLQLILGTMSLILMLAMTLWMLAEVLFPERRELPIALGAALVMAGFSVVVMTSVT